MGKALILFELLVNLALSNCQQQNIFEQDTIYNATTITENPSYSFSYGVSDSHTGDIKTVWESKEGDTVKGHYSVVEPDGSMRTVEYSAGPDTGFQATVSNEGVQKEVQGRSMAENKAVRDYDHAFDFSEDADEEEFYPRKYKKRENIEDRFREYLMKKRPKYPIDQEASAYTHTYSIKHPYRDESTGDTESYSHFGINTEDANCKKKKKNENNLYTSVADLDMGKQKYPAYLANSFKEEFEKYEPQSTYDFEKITPYKYIKGKTEDGMKQPSKYSFPSIPDVSIPDKFYSEDIPSRPKKKYKPYNKPEYPISSDDQDDYILVPKKKYKNPTRFAEANEYQPEMDDEYDRPFFNSDHDEDRYQRPIRGSGQKEIIRKVVKKKKPVINLLEIFDI